MNKKIILLYPYYRKLSGAYNRYLLLEKLLRKNNFNVKFILLRDKNYNSNYKKIFHKILKYFQVEFLVFYYCFVRKNIFITDYNPSIIALFSKKVFIQIHDVSWENKKFTRHSFFFYLIFKFFIKYYANILTVSKTSMLAIKKISGRKKSIFYLYNSVGEKYIYESNNFDLNSIENEINIHENRINLSLPNILYIATLIPRKCHYDLLEALADTKVLFNVNLVGLSNDENILDAIKAKKSLSGKKIKSNINYFPELSQRDLCNLLIYSSAYISTSMNEGFGIPVLEAQLYEIPLIIRDIDINRELYPNAKFFKSNIQLSNLLNNVKKLSIVEIKERKKIASKINQDKILQPYNYLTLSEELKNIILGST